MDTVPGADKSESGDASRRLRVSRWFEGLSLSDRLSVYSALFLTIGGITSLVVFFPDFNAKMETAAALSLIKDNPAGKLVVRDIGTLSNGMHTYDVAYTLSLKNSSTRGFDVEFSIDQIFLGTLGQRVSTSVATDFDDPPSLWDQSRQRPQGSAGLISWRLLRSDAQLMEVGDPDSDIEDQFYEHGLRLTPWSTTGESGGMTGHYVPEHFTSHTAHFQINALPTEYVYVSITYGLGLDHGPLHLDRYFGDDRSSFDGANPNSETVWLHDASTTRCRYGVIAENGITRSSCDTDGQAEPGAVDS